MSNFVGFGSLLVGRAVGVDNVETFVKLLGQNQHRIYLYVLALVPHKPDADDVMQETNLVLWREFATFEQGTNFAAWACRVAFHQVLAWRKRHQRDRLEFSEAFLTAVADELSRDAERLEERARALADCVERLPPHHRDLVRLRYSDGTAVEAIAAKLHRNADAVYRMLSRIRQTLHDCVGRTMAREGTA